MRRERKGIAPSEYQTSGQYEPPGSVPIPVRPPGSKPPRHPLFPSMEALQHSTDQQVLAWYRLASHPVLKECYESRDSLIDAMLNRLDELAEKEKKYDESPAGTKVQDRFLLGRFCEGTKPKSPSGKPIRICDILECPCECHANITAMFEMIGKERPEPRQNPEYLAMIADAHERTAAMLEGVRRATAMGRDDVTLDPAGPDAPDEIKIVAASKPQTFTPTGRRTRGSLEHEVLLVCERFANQEWEEFILCTPKFVAEEIGRIHTSEPPSTGAVSAVWARWEKLGFAETKAKPARFYAFKNPNPELGNALELDRVKSAAKRVKKRTQASTARGDGLLARAKEKKAAGAKKGR